MACDYTNFQKLLTSYILLRSYKKHSPRRSNHSIYAFAVAVALAEAQYALPYAMTMLATSVPHAPLEQSLSP
jgi:hypothetical protein